VYVTAEHRAALDGLDLADVAITSDAAVVEGTAPAGAFTLPDVAGVGVVPKKAAGEKCARCWKVLPDVGSVPEVPGVCGRCADAVRNHRHAA
jgi:isoleucyl-tRNA synthetase